MFGQYNALILQADEQVGAQTQIELKDKQLRIEDAVNATKVNRFSSSNLVENSSVVTYQ